MKCEIEPDESISQNTTRQIVIGLPKWQVVIVNHEPQSTTGLYSGRATVHFAQHRKRENSSCRIKTEKDNFG